MRSQTTIGVVVGRFQTPELHAGHRKVIMTALENHRDVVVVLGCARTRQSARDPLDYRTRKLMLRSVYPLLTVVPLRDYRSDEVWSEELDALIARMFPDRKAVLYGSRKSFIPRYSGKHRCVTVNSEDAALCATDLRARCADAPLPSVEFRAGILYDAAKRSPVSYQTVDVAVIDKDKGMVLLGGRKNEGGKLRFIGGFVDVPDKSLEAAAKREVREEASDIEIDSLAYLGSFRVDDWRYRGTKDGIMTAFFAAQYIFGAPRAKDDIDVLAWVPLDTNFLDRLVEEHQPLGKALLRANARKGI